MDDVYIAGLSVADIRSALDSGNLTSLELVKACLDEITRFDSVLRSVIEINPEALEIAKICDDQRMIEITDISPLHGIPVLIKDNIDTADELNTTAGSLALLEAPKPKEDAHIVKLLREAGAIILGKANMSEWAFARCLEGGISGWSARGGFCKNPYDLSRSPWGSSSGSCVAVAAGLVPLAVGTETDGSIVTIPVQL